MKLLFCGDLVRQNMFPVDFCYDFKKLLNAADYNIVNYEAPIKEGKATPAPKSGPSLSQSIYSAIWLIESGFNVLSLANNHMMDYGTSGLRVTLKNIEKSFQYVGAGYWEEAYQPLILEKNDIKVAIFSMTELQFGVLQDAERKDMQGCAWINHPSVNNLVRETKRQVDYVIIIAHAGLEGEDIPLPEWRERYRELIDNGCDVIIGGHTHTPQGYEIYRGKPIFYSLGNFCFESNSVRNPKWNIGECVSLYIDKEGFSFELYGTDFVNNQINLIDSEIWEETIQQLNNKLHIDYEKQVNEMCSRKLHAYNNLFSASAYIHMDKNLLKSVARFVLGRCNELHFLNNLQCETHRWTICRAIRIKNGLL